MILSAEQLASKLMGADISVLNESGARLLKTLHDKDSDKAHSNLIFIYSDTCPFCSVKREDKSDV